MTASAARRTRDRAVSRAAVVVLTAVNVTDHRLRPPWWVRALEGAGLVVWARLDGLTWAQAGLARDRLGAGCRWALGATWLVAGAYAIGVLLPPTRPAFQDVRYDLPLPDALRTAFVRIPLGTVALEELAFRSVLWGMLARHQGRWRVLLTTSALFGLWHVIPALDVGATNRGVSAVAVRSGSAAVVGGTVALTTVGGLVFGELRRRSGSVLASAGAHWATNGLGVLSGLVARRLDRTRLPRPTG
jgi:uncharacterized protein